MKSFAKRKDRRKAARVCVQLLVLAFAALALLNATLLRPRFQPEPGAARTQRQDGFVALSYFGIADEGTETLISRDLLAKHLRALKNAGFVTISQQDILDYYHQGTPLPENALFLFFEDGRKQSAILAQDLLEEHNFLASMLSYANNLSDGRDIFLTGSQLETLERNGFWELGTNGYRLSYINVFDRHDNYLGELTPTEYYVISPYVRREYNHFLMDFLRDAYDLPMESHEQLQLRIAQDYSWMKDAYTRHLGKMPVLYTLMHSNTDQFATHDLASAENEKWIRSSFSMNFNREMYSVNDAQADVYDLTRMQPQAYWSTNHLLMRIGDDLGKEMPFITGDETAAAPWRLVQGAAEFTGRGILLTSPSEDQGILHLRGSEGMGDFRLSTRLTGNKMGIQSVDLWLDAEGGHRFCVEIHNNVLRLFEIQGTEAQLPLLELDLDVHDGIEYQTWEENRQEAMAVEIAAKEAQAYQPELSMEIARELRRSRQSTAGANEDPYIPEITLKDAGDRLLDLTVADGKMTVRIDGKTAVDSIPLPGASTGGLALRCAWTEYGYSQRNLADDVYDGVFDDLYIAAQLQAGQTALLIEPKESAATLAVQEIQTRLMAFYQSAVRSRLPRDVVQWIDTRWILPSTHESSPL